MENALLISLSNQMAMRRTLEVIANNLANMNTAAFKRESMLFEEYKADSGRHPTLGRPMDLSFVIDWGVQRDFTEGNLSTTANPYDLAIKGDGYFAVETPEGERYTRNGHFMLDPQGTIVTSTGHPVLDEGGAPMTVDPEGGPIEVSEDGVVSNRNGTLGQLRVVTFENQELLEKTGDSLFTSPEPAVAAENFQIVQGMIEESNVQPIVEMTLMIDVLRSYQHSTEILQTAEDAARRAVQRLGEVRA